MTIENTMKDSVFVPDIDPNYVPWGNFEKILRVVKSGQFYPIWITGDAGNGKSSMVEQVCAIANLPEDFIKQDAKKQAQIVKDYKQAEKQIGREYIRVNFTVETDEASLLGGNTLVDGNVVYKKGPIVEALERGAVLLLDECDLAHYNRILCLQSILEGKGVLIKETGEYIKPAKGFTVFATSNTKGRGSDDGKYIGANVMNGAFMDRFAGMLKQDYPSPDIERRILARYMSTSFEGGSVSSDMVNKYRAFINNTTEWANSIRERFKEGGIDDVITTRSLINALRGYFIFGSQRTALELACERFSDETKTEFLAFYDKLGYSDEEKEV